MFAAPYSRPEQAYIEASDTVPDGVRLHAFNFLIVSAMRCSSCAFVESSLGCAFKSAAICSVRSLRASVDGAAPADSRSQVPQWRQPLGSFRDKLRVIHPTRSHTFLDCKRKLAHEETMATQGAKLYIVL